MNVARCSAWSRPAPRSARSPPGSGGIPRRSTASSAATASAAATGASAATSRSPPRTWRGGAGSDAASWPPARACAHITERLEAGWSPQQIAGRLRREADGGPTVCHETIYRHIYGPEGQRDGLYRLLPRARRRRGSRHGRKPRSASIPRERWIENRPVEVQNRESFGHWEADLLIFRKEVSKANVTSLVERKSRFTFLLPNEDKRSAAVLAGITEALRGLPEDARRTVTFERGSEFAGYAALDRDLAVEAYVCNPHSPWQKGGVENLNGRARRFLPRESPPEALARARLRRFAGRLNDTPRRCLGYRTPREVFEQHLAAPTGPP